MSEDTFLDTGATPLSRGVSGVLAPRRARSERLAALLDETRSCTKCPQLAGARTQVVVGSGDPDADLMFVAEAPGAREDEQGIPILGAAGKFLDELLATIGLSREAVFVVYLLQCHPPGNRDPSPAELTRCTPYLHEQVALIEPRVVCTLGSVATKLLRGDGAAIAERHGQAEIVTVGQRAVHLLPLFHPAAALYSRASRATLEADMLRLPELLSRPAPPQPEAVPAPPANGADAERTDAPEAETTGEPEPTGPSAKSPEPEPGRPGKPEASDKPEPPAGPQLGLF